MTPSNLTLINIFGAKISFFIPYRHGAIISLETKPYIPSFFPQMVNACHCGCHESLKMGSVIAAEVRQAILNQVGLTCCAGIAHNKLLAKLVGGWKKPNMQSTLLPKDAENLLLGLRAKDIPGIEFLNTENTHMLGVVRT